MKVRNQQVHFEKYPNSCQENYINTSELVD